MDSFVQDNHILAIVLGYAIPTLESIPPRLHLYETPIQSQLRRMKTAMSWVASLRAVNRRWKGVVDDPSNQLWLLTAQALKLDPPLQLFSGGTYAQVCKLLLRDKISERDAGPERIRGFNTICAFDFSDLDDRRVFPKHPNPERPRIQLPEDVAAKLCDTAIGLRHFLHSIDFSVLLSNDNDASASSRETNNSNNQQWHVSAFVRYKMFLHLKRLHPDTWVVPTADIQFCWLAHIFRTEMYWKDMIALGIDPKHTLSLNDGEIVTYPAAVKGTMELWEATFGLTYLSDDFDFAEWSRQRSRTKLATSDGRSDEISYSFLPFTGKMYQHRHSHSQLPAISLTAEEIKADLAWFPELQHALRQIDTDQRDVLRDNILFSESDRMRSDRKLYEKHLVPSYERFLNLCNQERDLSRVLAPPLVLDLIWHAHQVDPVAYKQDCLALFGREFWHHPWPHGLGVTSDLTSSFQCAWKTLYGSAIEEDWKLHPED